MVELTSAEPEFIPAEPASLAAGIDPALSVPEPDASSRTWADRSLWTMVGVGLMWWSWQLIADSSHPWTVIFLVLANVWGLGTVIASWLPDSRWTNISRRTNVLAWMTALLTVATFAAWATVSLQGALTYGTDAIAFNQYAAQLVQHGLNPYTHSMYPAFQMFGTPTSYYTYSFTGHPVTTLSYPSLSFLVYVPFLLLGWSYNLAPALNMFAWGLTVVLMFAFLPRRARPVALLLGGFGLYTVFALGGVTDALFMPLLTIAAYKWDRFGYDKRSYVAPVMFGLAMGIKQTPWPALPFILLALGCDEYLRSGLKEAIRRAGKYLAIVVAVFVIPNLPYIFAAPSAWVRGTLTPLFADMVPTGQGTMSLSLYLHLGGGSMMAFTLATVLMLLLLLVAYVGTYPLLRIGMFVLPAFVFFFAARSNVNYFISLIPAGFIAAATAGRPPVASHARVTDGLVTNGKPLMLSGWRAPLSRTVGPGGVFRSHRWAISTVGCVVLFVGAAVYSLTAASPIAVKIVGVEPTGSTNHIEQLSLRVTNSSGKTVTPSFDIMQGGFNSTFWLISQGPKQLAPRSSAAYTILAPNSGAEPSVGGGFNVVGYVTTPDSFSVSPTYQPNLMGIVFNPQTIDRQVPVGRRVTVTVQVLNHHGSILHRSGVLVKLGEIVWAASGPAKARARINGAPVGKSAYGLSNARGQVIFNLVGVAPNAFPVSFSGQIVNAQGAVYGDTGDLNVRFVSR